MTDEGKLFIGGLNFETTDESLEEFCSKYGHVRKAEVVRDRETQRSRGFGFVTFENPEDAKDAKAGMDGKDLNGKRIRVDEAGKPSGRSGGGTFRGPGQRGGYSGGRRGDFRGGYGQRSYDRGYDRGYGNRNYEDRNYGREGGFGGNRNYADEDRNYGGYRSGGNSRGGSGGGGYSAGYSRDRSQNTYGEQRSTGNYRDDYESFPSND